MNEISCLNANVTQANTMDCKMSEFAALTGVDRATSLADSRLCHRLQVREGHFRTYSVGSKRPRYLAVHSNYIPTRGSCRMSLS